ncbi:hypothetical protein QE382_004490 [Sphingobacterium zeae]|uniref:Uncharacterized protein n=1 Tax=Sphingobacterium zeae TaxID=1776859 RepID=A0ABU0UCD6_9SPHI|nr:hypothetical protein [Sphingobacterium zeae]
MGVIGLKLNRGFLQARCTPNIIINMICNLEMAKFDLNPFLIV